jgi:hypothetical protein
MNVDRPSSSAQAGSESSGTSDVVDDDTEVERARPDGSRSRLVESPAGSDGVQDKGTLRGRLPSTTQHEATTRG